MFFIILALLVIGMLCAMKQTYYQIEGLDFNEKIEFHGEIRILQATEDPI